MLIRLSAFRKSPRAGCLLIAYSYNTLLYHGSYPSSIGSVIKTHRNSQLANHRSLRFSSESPNCASAPHVAKFVQGAVPLGITQISWGTITKLRCPICSQKYLLFRNLASIVPTTHSLKVTSSHTACPLHYSFMTVS